MAFTFTRFTHQNKRLVEAYRHAVGEIQPVQRDARLLRFRVICQQPPVRLMLEQSVAELLNTGLTIHALPHPSAQGLLTSAPNRGKGARMADLEAAWISNLATLLR